MTREFNTALFRRILDAQSASFDQFRMFARIIRELKAMGATYYVKNGNIYAYRTPDYTMACVAHMDTVHDVIPNYRVVNSGNIYYAMDMDKVQQTGIGGDDKVGIFIALSMMQRHKNVACAFFRDEEVGCVGSSVADMEFFDTCNIVLQADRKGDTDFVGNISGTQLSSKSFKNAIKSVLRTYNRKICDGGLTDVYTLKELDFKGSVANASCGYYKPHTAYEYIDATVVADTLNMFSDIYFYTKDKMFDFEQPVYQQPKTGGYSAFTAKDWGDWYYDQELRSYVEKPKHTNKNTKTKSLTKRV